MIRLMRGDLFHPSTPKALGHGVNCAGAMGSGIAVQFRQRFPLMYQEYKTLCYKGGITMGKCWAWSDDTYTIFNLGTQRTWKAAAELSAVRGGLQQMLIQARARDLTRVSIPRIGAGLGRLQWDTVLRVIREVDVNDIELWVFEDYVPYGEPIQV